MTDLSDRASTLPVATVDDHLQASTDGMAGYVVKQVGGPIKACRNHTAAFYPASTIKALQHLHAIRAIDAGLSPDALVCVYPDAGESCCDDHRQAQRSADIALSWVLSHMMQPSDNPCSNAIQEFFGDGDASLGRAAINHTAHDIVTMSLDTQLAHKFACGGPSNQPANSLTLADIALLYERVASGDLLSEQARAVFYQLMLNQDNGFPSAFTSVIAHEAESLSPTPDVAGFLKRTQLAYKGGNLEPGFLSLAGWIEFPTASTPVGYVFGMFVAGATTLDKQRTGKHLSAKHLVAELLQPCIRAALSGNGPA